MRRYPLYSVVLLLVMLAQLMIAPHMPIRALEVEPVNQWTTLTAATWDGYKRHYILCGAPCGDNSGLVYDPASEYQATSEGASYGMLMAVMMKDQPMFDMIYDAAHRILLNRDNQLFHWRVNNQGNITGYGSATDAEQDIAAALIYADNLVNMGEWTQHEVLPYGSRANSLIEAIWTHEVVDGRYLKPGDQFSDGQEIINLSYFSPAWYRLFDVFQHTTRWQTVLDQGYDSLYATQGSRFGLAPDWSTAAGDPALAYCERVGRPAESCAYEMRYEAIRVPWRVALDCLWYEDERGCEWTRRSIAFLAQTPSNEFARMYDMSGHVVVDYQDEAMIGMWLAASLAGEDERVRSTLIAQLERRGQNAAVTGYWGESSFYYYNQSLAWFGAALLSGDFRKLV